jgi:hypothetical protein
LEKIFEPFFTTHRAWGSGIGLYLCYNIVTSQLNGTITCDSTVGKGPDLSLIFRCKPLLLNRNTIFCAKFILPPDWSAKFILPPDWSAKFILLLFVFDLLIMVNG